MNIQKQIKRIGLGLQEVRKHLPGHQSTIYYVVPEANWSIDWDGRYIMGSIREQFDVNAEINKNPRWLSGQIIHYGSLWSFVGNIGAAHNKRNKITVTVFHGNKDSGNSEMEEGINKLLAAQDDIQKLVISNTTMQDRFIDWGFPKAKLAKIPLGVDLSVFKAVNEAKKKSLRNSLNIPDETFCIGSFQKDGEGWGEGLIPKAIKGPDIFIEALEKISKKQAVHVLLTGPARGYVKRELEKRKIAYTHRLLDDYLDIANMYAALDMYMVSSREEGGPKGVLEALACGIPLVSTKVGLAPDVISHESNGLLVDIEDAEGLALQSQRIIDDQSLAQALSKKGLETIQQYDWMKIGAQYYEKVYRELIN